MRVVTRQRIGDAGNSALLWHTWARLEAQSPSPGAVGKALAVLQKGLTEGAQPAR